MKVISLAIHDVLLIEPKIFGDDRGFFFESFNQSRFNEATGLGLSFVQDNHSKSVKNVLRELHYQLPPKAQGKLVRAVAGEVFDVAVDIRKDSPTFGQWVGARLTAEGGEQLLVPRGFAHGYVTLTDDCELFYKVDGLYAPQTEGSLIWNDPEVGIEWPWDGEVILSDKDKVAPRLKDMPVPAF